MAMTSWNAIVPESSATTAFFGAVCMPYIWLAAALPAYCVEDPVVVYAAVVVCWLLTVSADADAERATGAAANAATSKNTKSRPAC